MKIKYFLVNRYYLPRAGGIEKSLKYLSKGLETLDKDSYILSSTLGIPSKELEKFKLAENTNRSSRTIRLKFLKYRSIYFRLAIFINTFLLYFVMKWLTDTATEVRVICRDPLLCRYSIFFRKNSIKLIFIPGSLTHLHEEKLMVSYAGNGASSVNNFASKILDWSRQNRIKLMKRLFFEAIQESGKTVVSSDSFKNQIIRTYGNDVANKITVLPFGKSYATSTAPKLFVNERIKFLIVSRLSREKGISEFLEALCKIEHHNIDITIVGSGPDKARLLEFIKVEKLDCTVRLAGHSPNIQYYYESHDILIVPSKFETFGNVIVEAMSFGMPTIGFVADPPRVEVANNELLINRSNGWLVDGDYMELAKQCVEVSKCSHITLNSISENCIKRSKNMNTWEEYLAKLDKIFDEISCES